MVPLGALACLLLTSCSTTAFQRLDTAVFYKRDIQIEVNGKKYEGVTVIPQAKSYKIKLESEGDMDMLLWRSCAREDSGSHKRPGNFLFPKPNIVEYQYDPLPGLEDQHTCPLRIDSYQVKNGQHSWAFLTFEHTQYQVKFTLDCNGRPIRYNGVGACQQKQGLLARVHFPLPTMIAPPSDGCPMPENLGNYTYKWEVGAGECLYHFKTNDGKLGKFITIGYSGVLVRGGV